ncbi:MAG TPA: hypothetical protein VEK84_03805 [Terriglobales bacterium]|nr:hypothetical protein [Terriglobales bacterium]
MPILRTAPIQDRKRLLELFPMASIKEAWPDIKGKKEELGLAAAQASGPNQIVNFIKTHIGRCKQHVYIFDRPRGARLPDTLAGGERVDVSDDQAVYIIKTTYTVVLREPLEEVKIDFLWPVRVVLTRSNIVLRFIVLEKNIDAYVDREGHVASRTVEEETVLEGPYFSALTRTDIHKGIRELWNSGFMDAARTRFKKPQSLASEAMDQGRGIRRNNPQLYQTLRNCVLLNTFFTVGDNDEGLELQAVEDDELQEEAIQDQDADEQACAVSALVANCRDGYLGFPRYSNGERNTDFVISEVLRLNR